MGALRVLLSATAAQFGKDLGAARSSLGSLGPTFTKVAAAAAAAGAAITAALGAIVKSTANTGDAFAKMSQRIGVSVEDLSALSHAANLSGTSLEGMEKGLGRLARNMSDATHGLKTAERAFEALGIEVKKSDGSLRPIRDVILEVSDRFAGMTDETKKTALAQELFGRSGLQMIPLLNQGSAAIREQMAEAKSLGIVWTGEAAKAAEDFNDNLTRLGASLTGVKEAIGKALLPTLVTLTDNLVAFVKSDEFQFWVQDIANNIRNSTVPMLIAAARGFALLFAATNRSIQALRGWINLWARAKQLQVEASLALEKLGGASERALLDLKKRLAEITLEVIETSESFFAHDDAASGLWQQLKALEEQLSKVGGATARLNIDVTGATGTVKKATDAVVGLKSVMDPELVDALAVGQRAVFEMRQEADALSASAAKAGLSVRSIMDPELVASLQAGKDAVVGLRDETEAAGKAGREAALQIKSISDPELLAALQTGQDAVARIRHGLDAVGQTATSVWAMIASRAASAWQSIGSAFASTLTGLIQGTASFGQFFISVLGSMLNAVVGFVVEMIANWVRAAVAKESADATIVTAHTAADTAMTVVTAEGTVARALLVTAGAKAILGVIGAEIAAVGALGEAVVAVMAIAGEMAAGVLAATAAALTATVVGAGLAPEYAAAAAAVGIAVAAAAGTAAAAIGIAVGAAAGVVGGALALAQGGIVTAPTLAMIGEGREPEAVIPLSRIGEFADDGRAQHITVVLDGRPIVKHMVRGMPREIRLQAGVTA